MGESIGLFSCKLQAAQQLDKLGLVMVGAWRVAHFRSSDQASTLRTFLKELLSCCEGSHWQAQYTVYTVYIVQVIQPSVLVLPPSYHDPNPERRSCQKKSFESWRNSSWSNWSWTLVFPEGLIGFGTRGKE